MSVMLALFVLLAMHIMCGVSDDPRDQLYFSGPVCLGDILMFECNVTGPGHGATVWRGTVLDCSNSDNTIVLLHSRFDFSNTTGTCNNGAVVARQDIYDSEEGWYTSQLNISINFTSIEATIECSYDDGMSVQDVGYYTFKMSDNDLTSCPNFSGGIDEKGSGYGSAGIAIAVVLPFSIATVILAGILFGIILKRIRAHKDSFTHKQDAIYAGRSIEVVACTSPTGYGKKGEACDSTSLCPADFDSNFVMLAEQLPAYKEDYKVDSGSVLDLDTLLMKLRDTVDAKLWYQFGMAIGVPRDTLERLSGYDDEQCLIEVADYWLRNHPTKPTWSEICNAMKKLKPVNAHAVAQGSIMQSASPQLQDPITLNYTAVIPKSLRSRLQKSASPPPIPPRMEQQNLTQTADAPPRPPKP